MSECLIVYSAYDDDKKNLSLSLSLYVFSTAVNLFTFFIWGSFEWVNDGGMNEWMNSNWVNNTVVVNKYIV